MPDFKSHKRNIQATLLELQLLIEKLQAMEAEILSQEEALYVISEFAYDWEYWQAVDGSYKYVSPSCQNITGYTAQEFYDNPEILSKIIVEKDWLQWQRHQHTLSADDLMEPLEFEIRTKGGERKWIHHVCRQVTNSAGENIGIRGSNREITDLKELQMRLEHVAGHDELTGLANRSLFLAHLEQRLKEAKRSRSLFAVAFIDLDGFKDINDTLGHDAGDYVLKHVAKTLQGKVRRNDIIARFGGDEFVALFNISSAHDSTTIRQKLTEQLDTTIHCAKYQLTIRLSIGMSLFPVDGEGADSLLSKADKEMYAMKASNKAALQETT